MTDEPAAGHIIIPFGLGAIKTAPCVLHGVPMFGIYPQKREDWGEPGQGAGEWEEGVSPDQVPETFFALAFQNRESVERLIEDLVFIRDTTDWSAVPDLKEP